MEVTFDLNDVLNMQTDLKDLILRLNTVADRAEDDRHELRAITYALDAIKHNLTQLQLKDDDK